MARAIGISIARQDHPRSRSLDNILQGDLQSLRERADRLRKMYRLNKELPSRPPNIVSSIVSSGELIAALDNFCKALDDSNLVDANVKWSIVGLSRESDVSVESTPSDCVGQDVRDFDEELAERLLSESMDRLTIVARDVSDLAAETAIDLALIETKLVQIDRAQAENWVLLRELTEQAQ